MKKKYLSFLIVVVFSISFSAAQKMSNEEVINKKNELIKTNKITNDIATIFDSKATIGYIDNPIAAGIEEITSYYTNLLKTEYAVNTVLIDRVTFKKYQIDKERVTGPDGIKERLVVYRVKKGKILRMHILQLDLSTPSPAPVVDRLIEGYRSSSLTNFMETLSSDIIECDFPTRCNIAGLSEMRNRYSQYLGPNHRAGYVLSKRIISGNFVIDDNYISFATKASHNIAIYEIGSKGKIKRISFLGF